MLDNPGSDRQIEFYFQTLRGNLRDTSNEMLIGAH
jgi:hypothetical protein